eukprot:scaffold1206_cov388-Prasinococcus_capsulatus_cf.AAC.58
MGRAQRTLHLVQRTWCSFARRAFVAEGTHVGAAASVPPTDCPGPYSATSRSTVPSARTSIVQRRVMHSLCRSFSTRGVVEDPDGDAEGATVDSATLWRQQRDMAIAQAPPLSQLLTSSELDAIISGVIDPRKLQLEVANPDPQRWGWADENTFHECTEDDFEKLQAPQALINEFVQSESLRLLLRKQMLDMIDDLRMYLSEDSIEAPGQGQKLTSGQKDYIRGRSLRLIDGPEGAGKSCALVSLALWARKNGWVVWYLPNGRRLAQGGKGSYIVEEEGDRLWDTPLEGIAVLEALLSGNEEYLAEIPVKHLSAKKYSKEIAACSNMLELVKAGIADKAKASKVAFRVRALLAQYTGRPVLIAIDEYNCLHALSGYREVIDFHTRHTRRIHAQELRLVQAFGNPDRLPLQRGVTVGGLSRSVSLPQALPMPWTKPEYAYNLERLRCDPGLGCPRAERCHGGDAWISPNVLLSAWGSVAEALLLMYNYIENKTVCRTLDYDACRRYHMLTDGNGREMRENHANHVHYSLDTALRCTNVLGTKFVPPVSQLAPMARRCAVLEV